MSARVESSDNARRAAGMGQDPRDQSLSPEEQAAERTHTRDYRVGGALEGESALAQAGSSIRPVSVGSVATWTAGQVLSVTYEAIYFGANLDVWFIGIFFNVWAAPLAMTLLLDDGRPSTGDGRVNSTGEKNYRG